MEYDDLATLKQYVVAELSKIRFVGDDLDSLAGIVKEGFVLSDRKRLPSSFVVWFEWKYSALAFDLLVRNVGAIHPNEFEQVEFDGEEFLRFLTDDIGAASWLISLKSDNPNVYFGTAETSPPKNTNLTFVDFVSESIHTGLAPFFFV